MRVLSLTQPWATLVIIGAKQCETRSRALYYLGEVGIHASKRFPKWARELCEMEPFKTALAKAGYQSWRDLPRGGVLGTVNKTGCYSTNDLLPLALTEQELAFGNYEANCFFYSLEHPRPYHAPIPAKGALGLWHWVPPQESA